MLKPQVSIEYWKYGKIKELYMRRKNMFSGKKSLDAIHNAKRSRYFVGDFLYMGWPTKLFIDGQAKKIELRHSLYWFWINL